MPIGSHASTCHVCGKHFLCGDCIVFICGDCRRKTIPHLMIECPHGHGMQKAHPETILGIKLACGCCFESAGMSGDWIDRKYTRAPKPAETVEEER